MEGFGEVTLRSDDVWLSPTAMSTPPLSAQSLPAPAERTWPPRPRLPAATELELQGETIGRYQLRRLIGIGGMASVYIGTCSGAADFSRIVAIKRMHPPYARDPSFVSRFRDEAWLCARLVHPNIVQTLDVVEWNHELLLVMEYVEGATLQALQADAHAAKVSTPPAIALGIMIPALHGLHAAHEATDDDGRPLGLVHRDCSPHNLMVGRDGNTKVLDFGVARARGQTHVTSGGELWGKFGYLAPEQIHKVAVDRRADVFAAGIVLWELLTGERLFREQGLSEAGVIQRVLSKVVPAPSRSNPSVDWRLDAVVLRALERDPSKRFESAREYALALEAAVPQATGSAVASFVERVSSERLTQLAELRADVRRRSIGAASKAISLHARTLRADEPTLSACPLPLSERPRETSRLGRWIVMSLVVSGAIILASRYRVQLPRWVTSTRLGALVARQATPPVPTTDLPPDEAALAAAPSSEQAPSKPVAPGPSSIPVAAASAPQGTDETVVEARPALPPASSASTARPRPPGTEGATTAPLSQASSRKRPRALNRRPQNRTAKPVEGASGSASCDPPTYLDSEGIRHFKVGCL